MNIPLVILVSIGAAITTTFIPVYSDVNNKLGEDRAKKYTNNILNLTIVVGMLLSIVGIVFTEEIVRVFAVGFDNEKFKLAVNFTRIFMISTVFTASSYVVTAYLQIKGRFTVTGLITIPRNIIMIVSTLLSTKLGVDIMIWGTLLALCIDLIFLLPFATREGYKYELHLDFRDKYLKDMFTLLGPIFIGVIVVQLNAIIDRSLASTLIEGSVSALNYANKLNMFVMALFITSISSVIYPKLSKLSTEGNKGEFNETIIRSLNSIIIIVIPISIGAVVLSRPIVEILFRRGEFDLKATLMTTDALIMYSIGMAAVGIREVLSKIFYSFKDTKTPMVNGIISVTINIILNLILIRSMKHSGLALATSISAIVGTLLLFRSLKKRVGYFWTR